MKHAGRSPISADKPQSRLLVDKNRESSRKLRNLFWQWANNITVARNEACYYENRAL